MSGFAAVGELAVGALPDALEVSTPNPFAALIDDPDAERIYLLIATPFDTDGSEEINGAPAPVGVAAVGQLTFTVSGAEVPQYLSDKGFTTTPSDTPANRHFPAKLTRPYEFRASLFDGAGPGGRAETGLGSIAAAAGDEGLDAWPGFAWDGRDVEIKVGGPGFAYADFGTVARGKAEAISATEQEIAITFGARAALFERSIHGVYAGTGGLEGGADLEGQSKPLAFGREHNVTPVLVDAASLVYQVHDGKVQAILAVRDKGVALTAAGDVADLFATTVAAGSFKTDHAHGAMRLGALADGDVTCDVEGDASPAYVSTAAEIARRIATARLGAHSLSDPAGLDAGSFNALAAAQPATVGIYETSGRSAAEVLDELLGSIGGWWGFDREDRLFVGRLTAPAAPVATLDDSDVPDGRLEALASVPPAWRYRVAWQRNWTVQAGDDLAGSVSDADRAKWGREYRFAVASDGAVRGRHRLARDVEVRALFDLEADAEAEATRLLALHSAQRRRWRAEVVRALFRFWLADTVRLAIPRFALDAGRDFVVAAIEERSANEETVLELWG